MSDGNSPKELLGKHLAHLPRQTTFLCQAVVDVLHEERDGVVAVFCLTDLVVYQNML